MRPSSPRFSSSLLSFQQTRHRHTYPSAAGLLSVPASTVARWHAGTPRQVSQKLIIAKGVGNYNCLRPAETDVIIQTLVSGAARASRKLGATVPRLYVFNDHFCSRSTARIYLVRKKKKFDRIRRIRRFSLARDKKKREKNKGRSRSKS